MKAHYYFQFDEMDHPAQLGKVGSWVITFSNKVSSIGTTLDITNVMPAQYHQTFQIRQLTILQVTTHLWEITSIEYADQTNPTSIKVDMIDDKTKQLLNDMIHDFDKYDVNINLIDQSK